MDDSMPAKHLASYIIAAQKKRDNGAKTIINRKPLCDSPSVTIQFQEKSFDFCFGRTPFNTDDTRELIDDKKAIFEIAAPLIKCPQTEFFSKNSTETNEEIKQRILNQISNSNHSINFPVVLKPNSDSLSRNVFIVKEEADLLNAIERIRTDKDHGDFLLAQQFLGVGEQGFKEIRSICLDGTPIISFEKDIESAIEGSLANPIYWEGAKPVEVTDKAILKQIEDFAHNMYKYHGIAYVGYDFKCDNQNNLWLLEGNSAPMGLQKLEEEMSHGKDRIETLTSHILDKIEQSVTTLDIS